MAKERLKLKSYEGKKPRVVDVEYKRATHIFDRELRPDEKEYEVYVDGELVGRIGQVEVSTSRSPRTSRIRWGIGHHMEWSWSRYPCEENGQKYTCNPAGLYSKTRRGAVSDMLGYSSWDVELLKGRGEQA